MLQYGIHDLNISFCEAKLVIEEFFQVVCLVFLAANGCSQNGHYCE